jgi:hypothetical protein
MAGTSRSFHFRCRFPNGRNRRTGSLTARAVPPMADRPRLTALGCTIICGGSELTTRRTRPRGGWRAETRVPDWSEPQIYYQFGSRNVDMVLKGATR